MPFSQHPGLPLLSEALARESFYVLDNCFDEDTLEGLARRARSLDEAGELTQAAVGRAQGRQIATDLRTDRTRWLDENEPIGAERTFWRGMRLIRKHLNEELFLGLDHLEAHYAIYPPGAFYARHRDAFRDDDARRVSCVLYLNPDWQLKDGGALRLYLPDGGARDHIDLLPEAGRMVVFMSHDLDHEVRTAQRERLSIAGWFRLRNAQPVQVTAGSMD